MEINIRVFVKNLKDREEVDVEKDGSLYRALRDTIDDITIL